MVQTHHLAHLHKEASAHPVILVHQDRSQILASINNKLQVSEVHKTLINQTAINQYLLEPLQQMPLAVQMC